MLSVGAWIDEDVQQLDAAILDMGNVNPCHGHWAIRRTCAPEQPRGAVVANRVSGRGKGKVGWEPAAQLTNGT